jgi:hypothetical protein
MARGTPAATGSVDSATGYLMPRVSASRFRCYAKNSHPDFDCLHPLACLVPLRRERMRTFFTHDCLKSPHACCPVDVDRARARQLRAAGAHAATR